MTKFFSNFFLSATLNSRFESDIKCHNKKNVRFGGDVKCFNTKNKPPIIRKSPHSEL